MTRKVPLGVIHGRFQGLHHGHMAYLLDAKHRCESLVVGLANPDPGVTEEHPTDMHRARPSANPFTYYERLIMTRDSLLEAGVDSREFTIVPFPVNRPELLRYYVPFDAIFFMKVGDEWDKSKRETFRSLNLNVEVMWEGTFGNDRLSGSVIRERMADGEPWEGLVTPAVVRFVKAHGLDRRVADLIAADRRDRS